MYAQLRSSCDQSIREAGILYWELYPDERLIDVYAPGKAMKTYGIDAVITVDVIAGLSVPVSKLFR